MYYNYTDCYALAGDHCWLHNYAPLPSLPMDLHDAVASGYIMEGIV